MDNNILGTSNIENLLSSINNLPFKEVDLNGGLDARYITPTIALLLSFIPLKPVRLAFDHMNQQKQFEEAIKLLFDAGFKDFTVYVIFNFNDTPAELYYRLKVIRDLNKSLGCRITGYPMRYSPTNSVKRKYVDDNWSWKELRNIQCMINPTHGIVSPNPDYFDYVFGKNEEDFLSIMSMDEKDVTYRNKNELIDDDKYQLLPPLTDTEYLELKESIKNEGLHYPIVVDESGFILDGFHRKRVCVELGITDYEVIVKSGMDEIEKRTFSRTVNVVRRQLNNADKRRIIQEQLADTPKDSDRKISQALGVSVSGDLNL